MHRRSSTAWQVFTALCTVPAFACTTMGTGARPPSSFAVAPPVWVTDPPAESRLLQTEIGEALAAPGLRVTLLEEPVAPECAEDVACLTRVGHESGQDTLVVARLARLGPTTLLRLQSVDVPVGAMEHTLQAVIDDTNDARLARSMRETAERLARLYTPAAPWYRRPPFIIAGALVVAATVTAVVLATRPGSPEPDLTVRAP